MIERDPRIIGSNETRTRHSLIDPLLTALGWDDPCVLTQEYSIWRGRRKRIVDYALHPPNQHGQPLAFIEAKRMREDLDDDHRNQALAYAESRDSVRYFGLTNGDQWEFYEILGDSHITVFCISIRDEPASSCAVLFLPFTREDMLDADDVGWRREYGTAGEAGSTHYDVLGVEPSISTKDVRSAYLLRIKQFHPDVSSDKNAHEKAKLINVAYEVLRDPTRRAEYDQELADEEAARREATPATGQSYSSSGA